MANSPISDPFRTLLRRILNVPKAEIDKIEADRPKRPKPKKPAV